MGGLSRGWYQDPDDPELARWHDGHRMTEHTLVIADQPQGQAPDPPDDDLSWSSDEDLSWSPDDLPFPAESLHTPKHRARAPEPARSWGLGGILPDVRWSKLAMPLGIVALVVAAAVGLQLRDDGGDRVGLRSGGTDTVSPADGLTSDDADRPVVTLPTTPVTAPSTTIAPPASSTTTTKAPRKTTKPATPAPTTTVTSTTVAAPPESTTTTTPAFEATPGESCTVSGATAQSASGAPMTCAPACDGEPNDLVWRPPAC